MFISYDDLSCAYPKLVPTLDMDYVDVIYYVMSFQ